MSSYSAKVTQLSLFLCYTLSLQGETLSETIQRVLPSVVNVKVQRTEPMREDNELITVDSGGSGFVLDKNHHIATNAHVIGEAKKIIIVDQYNKEYSATLIGKDEKTDIAILESKNFNGPVLEEEINHTPQVGEKVFAIGSPYSLGVSASYGIISATGRVLSNYPYSTFIQTDAAINPGNSGGPLFNEKGQLIGMNSTYFQKQGNYTNIGFAIPISNVRRITNSLIENKKIMRGYLGAELIISERYSRKMGYQNALLVSQVKANSSSAKAGLMPGDLITKIAEHEINDSGELHRLLEQSHPNDIITLTVTRNKEIINFEIKLDSPSPETKEVNNIGTADASEKLGFLLTEKNETIEVVTTYLMAKNVGILAKDLIVEINGNNIKSIAALNTQFGKLKELDIALLTIQRNNKRFILPIGSKQALKIFRSEN